MSELYLKQCYCVLWTAKKKKIQKDKIQKFKKQVKGEILDKTSKNIELLLKANLHLNKKYWTEIYFSLIHSYMNYEDIAWASTTTTKLKKIILKRKYVARIIWYANKQTHARPLLTESKALNVYQVN